MFDSNVILMSGGPDSALLMQRHHKGCKLAVWVDYGQPSRFSEFHAAREICKAFDVPMRTYGIDGFVRRNAVTPPGGYPLDSAGNLEMGAKGSASVIPARNLMLIAFATAAALIEDATQVLIGCCQDDLADYADCRPDFVNATSRASGRLGVRVFAPLNYTPKREIMKELREDIAALSVSCYRGGSDCGECNACVSRAEAVAAAVIESDR